MTVSSGFNPVPLIKEEWDRRERHEANEIRLWSLQEPLREVFDRVFDIPQNILVGGGRERPPMREAPPSLSRVTWNPDKFECSSQKLDCTRCGERWTLFRFEFDIKNDEPIVGIVGSHRKGTVPGTRLLFTRSAEEAFKVAFGLLAFWVCDNSLRHIGTNLGFDVLDEEAAKSEPKIDAKRLADALGADIVGEARS
jgi:hypothetical protein